MGTIFGSNNDDQMHGDPIDSWRDAVARLEAENKRLRTAIKFLPCRNENDCGSCDICTIKHGLLTC